MTNQQKTNIEFLYKILKKRNMVLMLAFLNNPSLFRSECDSLISEVIHKEWGNEGYTLKFKLYKYLECTKKIVEKEIGNYYKTMKAINSPILKNKRKDIGLLVKKIKKGEQY